MGEKIEGWDFSNIRSSIQHFFGEVTPGSAAGSVHCKCLRMGWLWECEDPAKCLFTDANQ